MSSSIRNIAEDKDGVIYASTTMGIAVIDSSLNLRFIDDDRISHKYIDDLLYEEQGAIYGLTNESEIFTIVDGKIVDYIDNKELGFDSIGCIIADHDNPGYVFIETGNSQFRYGSFKDKFKNAKTIDISPLNYVSRFRFIDGKLWICTRNGVGVYDGNKFSVIENVPLNRRESSSHLEA